MRADKQFNSHIKPLLYRKSGNGEYSLIKTITSNATTSFVDTDVKQGAYSYYVVSYNNKKDASKSGESQINFVSSVKLKSLKPISNGFKLIWNSKSGAKKYKVMRANESDNTFVEIASIASCSDT